VRIGFKPYLLVGWLVGKADHKFCFKNSL